jgi:molybdopterin converting factor small subunit
MKRFATDGAPAGSSGSPHPRPQVQLLLFASARVAAGTGRAVFSGATVGEVLDAAGSRYGDAFTEILQQCRIWVDGEPADGDRALAGGEEVAVLPPVSGGA